MVNQVHDVETRHRTFSLSLCHPLRGTDRTLLNLMALNHGINCSGRKIKLIIF